MSKKRRSVPKQASLLISPDGSVSASFYWDDLAELAAPALEARASAHEPSAPVPAGDFPLDGYRECRACPRRCGFDRVARAHPRCGDFELRVGSFGLALGDEPELSGTRGSGTLMLSGCPMRCPSCHSMEMVERGTAVPIPEFLILCEELKDLGAHNLQILSPTVHQPALLVALRELRRSEFALPIALKSSGYETLEFVESFNGLVDVWVPDLKYGPASAWAAKAGTPDYFAVATAAISAMIEQAGPLKLGSDGTAASGVLIRHVAAPLERQEREAIDRWLAQLPSGVKISVRGEFQILDDFSRDRALR